MTTMHRHLTAATMRTTNVLREGHQFRRSFTHLPARYSPPPPDAPNLEKSLLYGSEKGQELQREMEQSYSKVLARGKYVHKLNQHFVKPDKIEQYVALMYCPQP